MESQMEAATLKKTIKSWAIFVSIIGLFAAYQVIMGVVGQEINFLLSSRVWLTGILISTSLFGLYTAWSSLLEAVTARVEKLNERYSPLAGIILIIAGFLSVWLVKIYVFGRLLPHTMLILWFFLWASLVQAVGLKLIRPSANLGGLFALIVLVQGFVYQNWGIFSLVSTDPFSIGYSEAGRHYYASLYFSENVYGLKTTLPFLHPSRYLLLSIPFLVDGLPLWAHRLWQGLLWSGLSLATSILFARRMGADGRKTILFAIWVFLFFFQGPVYYHLQICVILILFGVSVERPSRSFVFIVLASIWAGISRVNWFPVPAMLAIVIYVLDTPYAGKRLRYLFMPALWGGAGLISAFLAQAFYIKISGVSDTALFGSSFTSDLIFSRLWPSEIFPLGVFPGALLVSMPLFLALYQILRGNWRALHPLRWSILLGMLLVLFMGGLVVSTKIGGGGELHNMDAYLVMLMLVFAIFFAGQVSADEPVHFGKISWPVVLLAVIIPLGFSIRYVGPRPSYDKALTNEDVQYLQESVSDHENVLFITERQLLTFDYVNGVTLIPEYEQSELMEMAMSHNRAYLEIFYRDLASHRFSMIIAEGQKDTPQEKGAFVNEDNAWVIYIGRPILCYYEAVEALHTNNIKIFVPVKNQTECTMLPFE